MLSWILVAVLGGILLGLLCYYIVRWMFRADEKMEDYRRAAGKLAIELSKLGLVKIPEFLVDFSVADGSAMGQKIIDLLKLFLDGNAGVLREFDEVAERMLAAKLKTAEGRAIIAARLAEASKPAV